jgi:hypothetical protein
MRFAEIDFCPFLGDTDPLPDSVLNTFQEFHWETYTPSKQVDVKTTHIWRYLCIVFGHSEEFNDRVSELLNRISFKLKNLSTRSRRIHTIHSKIQGIGKSAFFDFLSMLFGERYCVFHSSLDQYLPRFNQHLSSKLIHFCDDITSATKQQTRKLFPLVTAKKRSYEAKGQPVVVMRDHSELWISGNSGPLFVSAEDRRIVMYEACPLLKNDRAFWNALYSEFDDSDIGYAWFTFLRNRDIGTYHPDQSHTASSVLKSDAICESMTKSHVFIERLFSEERFHIPSNLTYLGYTGPQDWFANLHITKQTRGIVKGELFIRMSQNALYKMYANFMKTYFPGSKARNMSTFLTELENVGLDVQKKKQRIRKFTTRVVDCYWSTFSKTYTTLYRQEPEEWVINYPATLKQIYDDIKAYS